MRKRWSFWTVGKDDLDLERYLESKISINDFVRNLINDFRTGKIVDSKNLDLHRKKLEVDIRYKEIMIKIKEKELNYTQTFDKTPSSQAKSAIKVGINTESYEPPEDKKINEVIKNSWNKFVNTLKQNSKGEWTLTCKMCNTGFILPTKEEAINRFKIHLLETHNERVLE